MRRTFPLKLVDDELTSVAAFQREGCALVGLALWRRGRVPVGVADVMPVWLVAPSGHWAKTANS